MSVCLYPFSILCAFLTSGNSFLPAQALFLLKYKSNLATIYHLLPPVSLVTYKTSKPYIAKSAIRRALYVNYYPLLLFATVQT